MRRVARLNPLQGVVDGVGQSGQGEDEVLTYTEVEHRVRRLVAGDVRRPEGMDADDSARTVATAASTDASSSPRSLESTTTKSEAGCRWVIHWTTSAAARPDATSATNSRGTEPVSTAVLTGSGVIRGA